MASNYINKGVVRSVIEKIRLCRDRGYARYIPPLKVRGLNNKGLAKSPERPNGNN